MRHLKLFEEFKEHQLHFFIDMDGVLADFDAGVRAHPLYPEFAEALAKALKTAKLVTPAEERRLIKNLERDVDVDTIADTTMEIKDKLKDHPDPEIQTQYNKVRDLLHKMTENSDFFAELKPMPDAGALLKAAKEISGNLPDILTAAPSSDELGLVEEEKKKWMAKYFGGLYDKIFVTKKKYTHVNGKWDVLIDDRHNFIDEFEEAGGTGILFQDNANAIRQMREVAKEYAASK